jgi:DNA-directed RNA polymerase subunit RPC12/RpoP
MGFIKKTEDFICLHCGAEVKGTGYTNHCPHCLWSRHVDEAVPGDRASTCLGMMAPVGIEIKGQEYVIIHRCQKCGKAVKNKSAENDNFEALISLSK